MRFTSAFLISALLAFTVSSSPVMERPHDDAPQEHCATAEQYSAYNGGKGLSPEQFVNNREFAQSAISAGYQPPQGYKSTFTNLQGASLVRPGDKYKTTFLSSYDTRKCAYLCEKETGFKCKGFNIYYERAPKFKISKSDGSDCPYKHGGKQPRDVSSSEGDRRGGGWRHGGGWDEGHGHGHEKDCCTNPVSITQIKCVTLSYVPTKENAVNKGQYQNKFHIVIAGSDGFKKEERRHEDHHDHHDHHGDQHHW